LGGSGFVTLSSGSSTVFFTVNIPSDNTYQVTLNYAFCQSNPATVQISANGIPLSTVQLSATSTGNWLQRTDSLALRAGLNTLEYNAQSGQIAVDFIEVLGGIPLATRGATVNYVVYEAEDASYAGTLIGPDKTFTNLPSEASGRKAVQFTKAGDHVAFTLSQPANAVVIRYSIPDSASGGGQSAQLGVYINGVHFASVGLTSVYSWLYGAFPFTNTPSDGNPHHFYDDVRLNFNHILPAGTVITVSGESPLSYTIDLADFYLIPAPYTMPPNYLSVTDYGADPSGNQDALGAFNSAVAAARSQGKGVWIPAGTYSLSTLVVLNTVTVRGAGPWYTILNGHDFGFFGYWNPSTNVRVYDLAIFGATTVRDDSEVSSGIGGTMLQSVIQNVWIEHNKCGVWVDGPFSDFLITGCTIRNTFADGVNFHKGVTNSVVEQTVVRNTGDDCLAMWPEQPNDYERNTFRFNTLQLPILANTLAIYGGKSNSVTDNICMDTVTSGGGVSIGNRFNSVPLAGQTVASRNTLIRTGSTSIGATVNYGAVWFISDTTPITTPVLVSDSQISDSFYSAIQFYYPSFSNIVISNTVIDTASYAVEERTPGSATFNSVTASNLAKGGQWNCAQPFQVIQGSGNSGWSDVHCS